MASAYKFCRCPMLPIPEVHIAATKPEVIVSRVAGEVSEKCKRLSFMFLKT